MKTTTETLAAARHSYIYCHICGHIPHTANDEPNYSPLRYWSPDDGWRIGTLCRGCAETELPRRPHPDDYAYRDHRDDICTDDPDTDEDPLMALDW